MNKIDLISGDRLPQYREALKRLQDMIFMLGGLTALGGEKFILSGCVNDGDGNVSDGFVVINGELLPFAGGKVLNRFDIKETRKDVEAFGTIYPELYIDRNCVFSAQGEFYWEELEQIPTLKEVAQQIKDIKGVPVGVIYDWTGSAGGIPKNHMLCDGRPLSVEEYQELFDVIGVTYGGDGKNTFNLPAFGGRTSVGYIVNDDKFGTVGNTGGSAQITLTEEQMPQHTHHYTDDIYAAGAFGQLEEGFPRVASANEGNTSAKSSGAGTAYHSGRTGGNEPHDNMQPYIVLPKIIKVK